MIQKIKNKYNKKDLKDLKADLEFAKEHDSLEVVKDIQRIIKELEDK